MYVPHLRPLFVCGWTFSYFHVLAIMNGATVSTAVCVPVPGGSQAENLPAGAGGAGLLPGLGRFPGGGNGSPLQYSFLKNTMDRGPWWFIVHGVTKRQMRLNTIESY